MHGLGHRVELNRRTLLTGTAALTAAGLLRPASLRAQEITLGDDTLTVVSDGHLSLPMQFMLPEQSASEIEALLEPHGLPADAVRPDCNLTLLRKGDRLVLFDAGAGPMFQSSAGKLPENLQKIGVDPSEITDVVFTHAHPDHIWGVLDDFDEPVFGSAKHWISQAEWDYWRDEATLDRTPEDRKTFVVGARNRFDAIEPQIEFFSAGEELFPGVEVVDTAGHTAGHASFMLHGANDPVLIVGDALTHPVVSFERPDWHIGSDQDREQGAATRQKLLDRLVAEKATLVGFHLPYPGIGKVERAGPAYNFVPES